MLQCIDATVMQYLHATTTQLIEDIAHHVTAATAPGYAAAVFM
jgi:hypothetical protein